jgi:RNA ligase (TIGR02306 family)
MTLRKLASIAEITYIKPIAGADAIECAIVNGGWPVVVKKDNYKVGDVAIYLEIDSWIPHELAPFLSKGQQPREYNEVKGERLKTAKLRGQISQGLLIKLSDVPMHVYAVVNDDTGEPYLMDEVVWEVGEDLTLELGIQKWEPPIPAQLQGMMKVAKRIEDLKKAEVGRDYIQPMKVQAEKYGYDLKESVSPDLLKEFEPKEKELSPMERIELIEFKDLNSSDRGDGGFGSTGK